MNNHKRLIIASMVLLAGSTAGACGSDDDTSGTASTPTATTKEISGSVEEWVVQVDATEAPAGDVSFTIDSDGTIGHEFLIVKTDIAPGEIPLDGDHFPEDADGIEVIDEIGEFAQGTTGSLAVTLEPGSYQLVCNLPGHYSSGMYLGFDVT